MSGAASPGLAVSGMPSAARPAGATPRAAKLPSLDGGRFVAALLVTLFHQGFTVFQFSGAQPLAMLFRGGHSGVEYFFVLSGFIIYYSHQRDFSRPDRFGDFYWKRAARILPMLWLVLLLWGPARMLLSSMTTRGSTDLPTLLLDMALLPHPGPLVLGVTWTLQRELVFYLLFSITILSRRTGFALLCLWQLAIVVSTVLHLEWGVYGSALLDVDNAGFGLGLLVAAFIDRITIPRPARIALLGAALYVALLLAEWWIGGPMEADIRPLGRWLSPLLYSGAATILLIGLVRHDMQRPRPQHRFVGYLGGCSYVLYLVHGPVGSIAIRALKPLKAHPDIQFWVLSAASVAVALVVHIWLERPVLAWLRARRPGNRAA
jgi:peptidoglycan/LPS O-acetylase OafA/YrhL